MGIVQQHRAKTEAASAKLGADVPLHTLVFQAMSTRCEVKYATEAGTPLPDLEAEIREWVQGFEARYSRYRPDSLLSRLNAAAGAGEALAVDAEMEQLLDLCQALHAATGGMLDPTTGPLTRLWNYKEQPAQLPDEAQVRAALALTGLQKLERSPGRVRLPQAGMSLDFGGFGKEWAVDMVVEIARRHGVSGALVDFGHDIRCLGRPPGRPAWHIGLEDPLKPGTHKGSVALLPGKAIASSGDYLRGFVYQGRRYGHIVDPRSGRPVANGCLQATVLADNCLTAGMLTTVSFILGLERGLEFIQRFPGAEGLLTTASARGQTRGFWNHVIS